MKTEEIEYHISQLKLHRLRELKRFLDKEIRLSETAIEEGFEEEF